MKKILLLTNSLCTGGAQTYVITLVNELKVMGYDISVAAKKGILAEKLTQNEIKYYNLRVDAGYRWETEHFFKYILRFTIKYIPTVLYLLFLAWKNKYDFIICQQPSSTFIAFLINKIFKIPFINIVHHTLTNEFPPLFFNKFRYNLPPMVTISEEIKDHLISKWKVNPLKITVIINPIDLKEVPEKEVINGEKNIIYVSYLHSQKMDAVRTFIGAAPLVYKEFQNVKFTLIGGGESLKETQELAEKVNESIGTSIVKVMGAQSDVYSFIKRAAVFIGIARSAREAMAIGIPVILSGHLKGPHGGNYGGVIDEYKINEMEYYNLSGRNSKKTSSPEILSKDILKLLQNKNYANEVARFGRLYIEQKCSIDVIGKEIEKIIKQLSGV